MDDNSQIFDLTETSYIEAAWFVAWEMTDWMALVYRDTPEGPWRATYRFRYYADGARTDAFDSDDRKSGYHIRAKDGTPETRDRLVHTLDLLAARMVEEKHARLWKLDVQGDTDRYTDLLVTQPWAHVKVSPKMPTAPQ